MSVHVKNPDRMRLHDRTQIRVLTQKSRFAGESGGGGNRTRVRGRTGMSVYKHRSPFRFTRRPVGDRPTVELALLKCRAAGEWLSVGAEPAS
jgi:hypothetical protein